MGDFVANFEPGSWKDFSKQHALLRREIEGGLEEYSAGRTARRFAVWGSYGAGKTQFLYAVAEEALKRGLVPIYLHLNDLLDELPEGSSPDAFARHANAVLEKVATQLREGEDPALAKRLFRDAAFFEYVRQNIKAGAGKVVALVDEIEQSYASLMKKMRRTDDTSPFRAWLDDRSVLKVFAFAVGSLYVLGKADRERLEIFPIPPVDPAFAKKLYHDLGEETVNSLWWLSRGKPRHLIKAAARYRATQPLGAVEIYNFVSGLDAVSQAPYAGESHNAVPAAYLDQLKDEESANLLSIGSWSEDGEGFAFQFDTALVDEFAIIIKQAFGMEGSAYDLARYAGLIGSASATQGLLALTEKDMPYFLRLAVDYLLEYERERLEKETVEGSAALQKLLEIHDRAADKGSEVFWKLQRNLTQPRKAIPTLSFAALYSAFPLPTTSPTLFGTDPHGVRAKFEELHEPVFHWEDSAGNHVYFLTSVECLNHVSTGTEFRQHALAPTAGTIVLLPHNASRFEPVGFLSWLQANERLTVAHLPLALSDFLLSLKASNGDGYNPLAICQQAETNSTIRRQVAFYHARLQSFLGEVTRVPRALISAEMPKSSVELESRVSDKDTLTLAVCQAFEGLSPNTANALRDLRELILDSRALWPGHVAIASEALPYRNKASGRAERPKLIEDVKAAFAGHLDSLRGLAAYVEEEECTRLATTPAAKLALRSIWQSRRNDYSASKAELALIRDQVIAMLETAKRARTIEGKLRKIGVDIHYGQCAAVLEAMPALESVLRNLQELTKGSSASERNLAGAIYQRMLRPFVDSIGGEMAKLKADLLKIDDAIEEVAKAEAALEDGAYAGVLAFCGIDSGATRGFARAAREDCVRGLSSQATAGAVVVQLAGLADTLAAATDEFEQCRVALTDIEHLFDGDGHED